MTSVTEAGTHVSDLRTILTIFRSQYSEEFHTNLDHEYCESLPRRTKYYETKTEFKWSAGRSGVPVEVVNGIKQSNKRFYITDRHAGSGTASCARHSHVDAWYGRWCD